MQYPVRSLGQQHDPLHVLGKNRRKPHEFSQLPVLNANKSLLGREFFSAASSCQNFSSKPLLPKLAQQTLIDSDG
jgi:hypothetical protein